MVIDTRIVFSIQNTNLYGPFIFLKEWYNLDFKDSPFNYQTLFYFFVANWEYPSNYSGFPTCLV